MSTVHPRLAALVSIVFAVVLSDVVATPAHAEFQEVASFTADSLTLENLIGEIRVEVDTGSGGIRVGREGVELLRQDRDQVSVKIGDGAAHVSLQTGSGSIKIK